ncbi:MAG TPA: hypothetical protein ENK88_04880 [Campylobacterales bacterium]|nr:hypothetical protein [Campylobacterales bacterium]
MDFVAILSTGVSGFAFLMLYIGFTLTSSVQKKILDVNIQDTDDSKLVIWGKLAEKQLINTRYFMGFSIIVLAFSLFVLQLQFETKSKIVSSNKINLTIPTEYMPIVRAKGKLIKFNKDGEGNATVKDEDVINIENKNYNKIFAETQRELRESEVNLKDAKRRYAELLATQSDDSGLGSMFKGE